MEIKVVVIPSDEDEPLAMRELEQGNLRAMQEIVGGLIEFTDIPAANASLVSNEEGLIYGLPLNTRATAILHTFAPIHTGHTILVGDCFICGLPDQDGDTQSVPDNLLKMLDLEP